jgi:hypothetical protein
MRASRTNGAGSGDPGEARAHESSAAFPARNCATLFITGDCVMVEPSGIADHRRRNSQLITLQAESDVVLTNCEMVLSDRGRPKPKDIIRAQPSQAPVLRRHGITIAGLANNHVMDLGPEGLLETIDSLNAAHIATTGAGTNATAAREPAFAVTHAGTVAVVAFFCVEAGQVDSDDATECRPGLAIVRFHAISCMTSHGYLGHTLAPDARDITLMTEAIQHAALRADVVVVSLHFHVSHPFSASDCRPVARAAVTAGAALIVGHGSHKIELVEEHDGVPIFYGLGNFSFQVIKNNAPIPAVGDRSAYSRLLFSFTTSSDYWESLALRIRLRNGQVDNVELIPLTISRDGNPSLAPPGLGRQILEELAHRSASGLVDTGTRSARASLRNASTVASSN